jgi:hypothetical protein
MQNKAMFSGSYVPVSTCTQTNKITQMDGPYIDKDILYMVGDPLNYATYTPPIFKLTISSCLTEFWYEIKMQSSGLLPSFLDIDRINKKVYFTGVTSANVGTYELELY